MANHGAEADDWGIRWGSIRQCRELAPKRQIWCRSAAPWPDASARCPAGRPVDLSFVSATTLCFHATDAAHMSGPTWTT